MSGFHDRVVRLASTLALPLDVVTQTLAVLAKRRAGKSYLARRIAEQLLRSKQQVCIVDPKGDWYGIRSSADGKGPGYSVVILGGERGDAPLEASAGEVVARLVVEDGVSVLLDLSLFRKHEVATFMAAFLEALYRLKARDEYRTAMMLIVDEADAVAPQKPFKGEERMLGAAEDIVRRGGQRGIGCTLVTQRSAVLNKNVLTQAQVLVALRTIAPQDLDALNAWVDVHGTPGERKTLMESLPGLPVGNAWVWSPGWPDAEGIFKRIEVLPIETFDSGATPRPGERRREPKQAADVDLEALRRRMAATLERAKADDPRELRRRIAELEQQLRARVPAHAVAPAPKVREVLVVKEAHVRRLEVVAARAQAAAEAFRESAAGVAVALRKRTEVPRVAPPPYKLARVVPEVVRWTPGTGKGNGDGPALPGRLTGTQQRIIDVARDLVLRGITPSREAVARWQGIHPNGGRYLRDLAALRAAGLLNGCTPVDPEVARPRTRGLDGALEVIDGTKKRILEVVISAGAPVSREQLAAALGIHPNGGRFLRDLAWLRTMGVITERTPITTTEGLFR